MRPMDGNRHEKWWQGVGVASIRASTFVGTCGCKTGMGAVLQAGQAAPLLRPLAARHQLSSAAGAAVAVAVAVVCGVHMYRQLCRAGAAGEEAVGRAAELHLVHAAALEPVPTNHGDLAQQLVLGAALPHLRVGGWGDRAEQGADEQWACPPLHPGNIHSRTAAAEYSALKPAPARTCNKQLTFRADRIAYHTAPPMLTASPTAFQSCTEAREGVAQPVLQIAPPQPYEAGKALAPDRLHWLCSTKGAARTLPPPSHTSKMKSPKAKAPTIVMIAFFRLPARGRARHNRVQHEQVGKEGWSA